MDMKKVVSVCESIGVIATPGPLGVRVGSTGWRIERGSGIAGHGGEWWLRTVAGMYSPRAPDASASPVGPIRTPTQLKSALRNKWKSLPRETTETGV